MAPHSSTLAWKIPWTEEPGRLQSMGSQSVGHDWAASLSLSCIGEGNGNPLQCSCLENPRDGGAWWEAFYGVAQSWTWLKQLFRCSSSSITTFTKTIIIYLGLQHFSTCNWHHENKKHRKGHHNLHPVTESQSLTPLARCSSVMVKNYYFLVTLLIFSYPQ